MYILFFVGNQMYILEYISYFRFHIQKNIQNIKVILKLSKIFKNIQK